MFGAGCFIYSGRTYTTDLQSRLTRFRPVVLYVANILLSVDASIAQRQGVSAAHWQHELGSAPPRVRTFHSGNGIVRRGLSHTPTSVDGP
jgi:hypothetical protein